jgi:hypothetical protein
VATSVGICGRAAVMMIAGADAETGINYDITSQAA